VSLLLSYAAFATFAEWGQFAPVLIAVIVAQLYERARGMRKGLVEEAANKEKEAV
jgi:hypothetical protein